MVTLPGEATMKGVVVENKCPDLRYRDRMAPLEIQLSADGAPSSAGSTASNTRRNVSAQKKVNAVAVRKAVSPVDWKRVNLI